tara:strand:- start:400 stop:1476 length:1077 start_codon:yes stop_codon:yes gene_type:complete
MNQSDSHYLKFKFAGETHDKPHYFLAEIWSKGFSFERLEEEFSKHTNIVVHNFKEEIVSPKQRRAERIDIRTLEKFPNITFTIMDSGYENFNHMMPRNAKHENYPLYFLYQTIAHGSYFDDDLGRTTSPALDVDEDTHFQFLNSTDRDFRTRLWDMLEKDGLLNKYCSFLRRGIYIDIKRKWLHQPNQTGNWHLCQAPSPFYGKVLIDLCVETRTDRIWFTEKTFKPLFHKKVLFSFCGKGYYKAIEDMGFKLHRDLIDYSFDDIEDDNQRFKAFYEQFKQLISHPINKIKKDTKEARDHNKLMCFNIINDDKRGIPDIPYDHEPKGFFDHVKEQSYCEIHGYEGRPEKWDWEEVNGG